MSDDTMTQWLTALTLDQVDYHYRTGNVSQDWFEAYMYAHATFAPRFGAAQGWDVPPTDTAVCGRVRMLADSATNARWADYVARAVAAMG